MKRPDPKISDRELKALLQGLRPDVAAPASFRQGVLERLRAEGLIASTPAPLRAGLRLPAWLRPAGLGLGLAAAAALLLTLVQAPTQPIQAPALAPSPALPAAPASTAAHPQRRSAQAVQRAQAPAAAARPAVAAAAPAPLQHLEQPGLGAPAPGALGSQPQASPSQSVHVASSAPAPGIGSAELKPTVVVPQPTPLSLEKGLAGDSEVRNNVVRESRGEAALILFNVKSAGRVRVEVFDRLGASVAVLRDEDDAPGLQSLRWSGGADNGGRAASGIYMVRILTPDYEARHKLILVR